MQYQAHIDEEEIRRFFDILAIDPENEFNNFSPPSIPPELIKPPLEEYKIRLSDSSLSMDEN